MISEHQLFHLNAVLAEANETKNLKSLDKNKLMKNKKVKEGKEDEYLDKVIQDVEKIKTDNKFPELNCASAIHDYLEKETKEEFHG